MQVRHRWCAFCTDKGFMFSASPSPQLPLHKHLAYVQTLYRGTCCPEFAQISIHGALHNCSRRDSLQTRQRWCAFCTDPKFTFSVSPSPSLPFQSNLALVQTLYRSRCSPEFAQISIHGAVRIAAEGVVCRSVTVGAHTALTQGLRFQAFHLLCFLFI